MHDLIIRNASVYDGTGDVPRIADVAIEGERIAEIGTPGAAREELDATGLALAPGFIDVHTHDDFAAVLYPDMAFKVCGGVTTCIVGNCGMGAAPFRQAAVLARAFHPGQELPDWGNYHGYFDTLEAQPPSVNVGVLVGHGSMRMAAMQRDRGEPSADQMAQMKTILAEGLEAGALGLSTGLIYDPGKYAATEELIELAATMPDDALYATHMRDEGKGLLESIQEALRIGESAGVPIQISHHKASGHDAWGLVNESLKLIDAARARGVNVDADQYPYTAGSTILSAVLAKDVADMRGLRHEDVVIASTADHSEWEGKSLAQLALELALPAHETARHVLATEPGATVILHSMNENDVQTVMRHPSTMIGSDGIPTLEGRPHPRLYGTFARVLGHYARDLGLFSTEEAVHRMTGMPAAKFGLTDRGEIRVNGYADLVLFDPARVIDVGTFDDPNHYPDGIVHVFVNGRHTVANGTHRSVRNGKTLRRASSK
jgi:N-acyl-D-amino-acid deacylase